MTVTVTTKLDFSDAHRLLIIVCIAEIAFIGAAVAASLKLRKSVLPSEGLKVVYEGENPELDIVCVHGLGGDPAETWTSRRGQQKLNWTKDFLPKSLKGQQGRPRNIRVLTYGYSLRLFRGSPRGRYQRPIDERMLAYLPQALYLHSNRLIEQLADLKVGDAEKRRVIFIAHSFGGLIVKSALAHASAAIDERDARLKSIQLLTVGVFFFGTPQRNSSGREWSDLLGKMLRASMPTSLDRAIQPLADQAEILNLEIGRYKSIESHILNFSFFERAKSQIGGVENAWAWPIKTRDHTWEMIPLRRRHNDLAKFDSDQDKDFLAVVDRINRCLKVKHYQSALERHAMFFDHLNTPRESIVALSDAHKRAKLKRVRLAFKFARVNSTDSEEEIAMKQKKNESLLNRSEKENGLSDLWTLTIVRNMASDALEGHKYRIAEALYKRLFVAIQETYTPCNEEVAAVLRNIARVAVHRGQLIEATKTFRRVRDIQLNLGLREESSSTLEITEQVIKLCATRGLYEDALQEVNKIVSHLEAKLGKENDKTLQFRKIGDKVRREKDRSDRFALDVARYPKVTELNAGASSLNRPSVALSGH